MEKNLNDVLGDNSSVPSEETHVIDHEEDEIAYTSVEEMPAFPGGAEGLMKYIQSNLTFPQHEKENGISGTVYVYFIINKEGNVEDAKIVRGVKGGVGLDNEALRVIKAMPKWSIPRQNGKPVKVQFTYPVKFVLK
jgi:protein TonB